MHRERAVNTAGRLLLMVHLNAAVLRHRAVTHRVCHGSQLPEPDTRHKPLWEGSVHCKTANERPPPRGIYGKASPPQPVHTGMQTSSSWSPSFKNLTLTWADRLPRPELRGQANRQLQGPSRLRRRHRVFSVYVVKYCNKLRSSTVMLPSVLFWRSIWTINGVNSSSSSDCSFHEPTMCIYCFLRLPRGQSRH